MTDPHHGVDRAPAFSLPSGSGARAILDRLRRIEDDIRGLDDMAAKDASCINFLSQVATTQTALSEVAAILLDDHVRRWGTRAMTDSDRSQTDDKVDELMAAVRRFAKHR